MIHDKHNHIFTNLLNDYAAWLTQVLLVSIYDAPDARKKIVFPVMLPEHLQSGAPIPLRVRESQRILHGLANKLLEGHELAPRDVLETFLITFETLHTSIQKLEHGLLLADHGIDELTGMSTHEKMIPDLEKELERRARRGQPFCFAISRIDGDEARKIEQNIILAAECIQKTLRSFDEAYVTGEGEFLSSLKHTDTSGALRFVARLNDALAEHPDVKFTMSSIVAEPLPGDNIEQLVNGVRQDLNGVVTNQKAAAVQYEEVSPLTQYLKTLNQNK